MNIRWSCSCQLCVCVLIRLSTLFNQTPLSSFSPFFLEIRAKSLEEFGDGSPRDRTRDAFLFGR